MEFIKVYLACLSVFCGRNYKAKYERSSLDDGIEKYMKLIDEAPIDDKYRFYISGGLEPLTNPKLREIINKLKNKILKFTLYNAFMLSEKYLNKQMVWKNWIVFVFRLWHG